MAKATKFEILGNDIIILRDDWRAVTTYCAEYYNKIAGREWRKNDKGYIVNSSFGYLHRYVMGLWYGEEVLNDMTQKGYVVDHMNNDHSDCRISNLEFLKKSYNTAKGQAFDVDAKELKWRIAVNLFKDFSTGCYQITIGCNDTIIFDVLGEVKYVNVIRLLYDCDYSIVINDAENILREYETTDTISLNCTHACEIRIETAPMFRLSEEEQNSGIVCRDGDYYFVLGTGKNYLDAVHYEEGWRPAGQRDY